LKNRTEENGWGGIRIVVFGGPCLKCRVLVCEPNQDRGHSTFSLSDQPETPPSAKADASGWAVNGVK
jgi:hypothetical protein